MPTWRKSCEAFTVEKRGKSQLLVKCGAKAFKQRLCLEHYEHARELAAARGRFNAVNVKRRLKNAAAVSGRQWTKMRKAAQRELRAQQIASLLEQQQAPTVEATYELGAG